MASTLSKKRDELIEELEDQVASLKREVSSLRRAASRRGANVYDDVTDFASELYNQLWKSGKGTGQSFNRQVGIAGDKMREYPVATTVVGLAVIGLLASMLISRRD